MQDPEWLRGSGPFDAHGHALRHNPRGSGPSSSRTVHIAVHVAEGWGSREQRGGGGGGGENLQGGHARDRVVPPLFQLPGVDDVGHVVDGDGGLGDVGGQDDL